MNVIEDLRILRTVLKEQGGWRIDHIEAAITMIEDQAAEIARLRKGLEQFADPEVWDQVSLSRLGVASIPPRLPGEHWRDHDRPTNHGVATP